MAEPSARLEGVPNFRDLGGAETADGRRVRARRLYRSGSLHEMTEADRTILEDLGIRIVIDLRCEWERLQHPYRWPGVARVAAPLVDDRVVIDMMDRFKAGTVSSEELEDWWHLSRVFQAPEEQVASIHLIFDTLLQPRDDAVLIHCRGGKDRTGMVSAFVLEALGVQWDQVMADFLRSNEAVQNDRVKREIAAMLARAVTGPVTPEAVASLSGVRAEWLEALFARVAGRYGSVTRYLSDHIGVGEDGMATLRQVYLEP